MLGLLLSLTLLAPPEIDVLKFAGPVSPASARYFTAALGEAERRGAQCLVLELDTPGGLDESMRDIVQAILGARVPVVSFVYPPGARAASAGVFIVMASHIAAMAPGTNIGAAHPVAVGGQMDSTMKDKVTNDAIAYLKSIAEKRHRNIKWAARAVRASVSSTATEAVRDSVVDLLAVSPEHLLSLLDGRRVELDGGATVLATRGAPVRRVEMNFVQKLLAILSNPNIAYILLLLGIYGLFFELQNPGAIFPGIVGGICLILAFYSFQLLPVNYAGLALILLAIVLFILEVKVTSFGLLTIGGIVAMVLGSLMLFQSSQPFYRVSWGVIVGAVVVTVVFFVLVVGLTVRAYRRRPTTGPEGMVGEVGEARTDLLPEGTVLVHGEHWSARARGTHIRAGEKIRVVAVQGMTVEVEPK